MKLQRISSLELRSLKTFSREQPAAENEKENQCVSHLNHLNTSVRRASHLQAFRAPTTDHELFDFGAVLNELRHFNMIC
jgi:hypothetical protein